MSVARSFLLSSLSVVAIAACDNAPEVPDVPQTSQLEDPMAVPAPSEDMVAEDVDISEPQVQSLEAQSLEDVINHERRGDRAARDAFRNPQATLEFFGLEPDMTVVEISPGGGWYTDILAPYINGGGGTFYAAHFSPDASGYQARLLTSFKEKYMADEVEYGPINLTVFSPAAEGVAPDGVADMVLTFRNTHNWGDEFGAKAFSDFYDALKPGGVLGVVDHRMPEDRESNSESGYIKTSTVIAMAENAGFELVGQSELNANPKDTSDHPFGVW
ncbi:MAG: methyltransferase, partial [Pseudomonadota bacterium]